MRGHDTIKKIHSLFDDGKDILEMSDAKKMTRFFERKVSDGLS